MTAMRCALASVTVAVLLTPLAMLAVTAAGLLGLIWATQFLDDPLSF